MLRKRKKILIFGAGNAGKNAISYLETKYTIIAFIDNGWKKIPNPINDIPVLGPEELPKLNWDKIFIASEKFEEIECQLKTQLLIEGNRIKILPARYIKNLQIGKKGSIKDVAETILFFLSGILQNSNIVHFVDAGTLLGIYRDGELIPWDDDLDFSILNTEAKKVFKLLSRNLDELKKITNTEWVIDQVNSESNYGAVNVGDLRVIKLKPKEESNKYPYVDFFVRYINEDMMDYVLSSRGITMPSKHIHYVCDYIFKDNKIKIPGLVENYLTRHYGDWKTPIKDWNLSMLKNATLIGK